jgi:hypothetical protein
MHPPAPNANIRSWPRLPRYTRSDSIPYATFRAAVDVGNLARVQQLAKSLGGPVKLADALRICLLLRDGDPERYERAAVRWVGRFALEARGVTTDDVQDAARLLDILLDDPSVGMERLQRLCVARGVG